MDKITLHDNLAKIRQVMDSVATIDSPESVLNKLNELQNIIGLSSECMAWASKLYEEKVAEYYISRDIVKKPSAMENKIIANGHAKDEGMLLNYANGINKDVHYQINSLVTMLSYLKEELKKL